MAFLISKRKSVALSYYQEEEDALFRQVTPRDDYQGYLNDFESARRGEVINLGFHTPSNDRRNYRVIEAVAAAPKVVSLLFAFGDRHVREAVLAAHMVATDETLMTLESQFNFANVTRGGVSVRRKGVLEPIAFTHILSRSRDPHLHSHILIPNSISVEGLAHALSYDLLSYGSKYADIVYLTALKKYLARPEILEVIARPSQLALCPQAHELFSRRSREIALFDVFQTPRSRRIAQRSSRQDKGDLSEISKVFEMWQLSELSRSPSLSPASTVDLTLASQIAAVYKHLEDRAITGGLDHFFLHARERVRGALLGPIINENPLLTRLSITPTEDLGCDPVQRIKVVEEETLANDLSHFEQVGGSILKVRSNAAEDLIALDGLLRRSIRGGVGILSISQDRIETLGDSLKETSIDFNRFNARELKEKEVMVVTSATALPSLLGVIEFDNFSSSTLVIVDSGRYREGEAIGRGASIRQEILQDFQTIDGKLRDESERSTLTLTFDGRDFEGAPHSAAERTKRLSFHPSARSLIDEVVDGQASTVICGGLIYPDQHERQRVVVEDDKVRSAISKAIGDRVRKLDESSFEASSAQFRGDNSVTMKEKYLSFCEIHPLRKEVTLSDCGESVAFNAFGVMSTSEFIRSSATRSHISEVVGEREGEICRSINSDEEVSMRVEPLPISRQILRRATFGERAIRLLGTGYENAPRDSAAEGPIGSNNMGKSVVDMVEHLATSNVLTHSVSTSGDSSLNRRIARIVDIGSLGQSADASDGSRIVANVRTLSRLVAEKRRYLGAPQGISPEKVTKFVEVGLSYLENDELHELNRGTLSRLDSPRDRLLERELGLSL